MLTSWSLGIRKRGGAFVGLLRMWLRMSVCCLRVRRIFASHSGVAGCVDGSAAQEGRFEGLSIAIVGDIRHSRFARSSFHAFHTLGVPDIRVIAPSALMPDDGEFAGCSRHTSLADGLKGVDVVMMLRIQRERMGQADLPDADRYFAQYGLTSEQLGHAKADAIVMHPQPMNRGIEIASDVADGRQSVIRDQVRNGVAVRMAVLADVIGSRGSVS